MKKLLLSIGLSGLFLIYTPVAWSATDIQSVTDQQTIQGVPVFGGQTKLYTNPTTGQSTTTGKLSSASVIDVVPTLSSEEAVGIAQSISGQSNTTALKKNLYIFNEHLLNKLKASENILVWQIELYKATPVFNKYYFINANTGTLVYTIDGTEDIITRQIYDCSFFDGDCYIDELDPVTGYIYGRSEGQPARGENPYWYIVSSLTDTDDLYDNLGNIYDYYLTKFSREGANGNSGMGDGVYYPVTDTTGLTYIDYSSGDSSSCPNAFFDGIGSMHYCDGFVTNDISGHEYAHAVNYFSILDAFGAPAGLSYTNETGALNEANSDVFGEALEYSVTGDNDWLIGEDSPLGTLRSMSDPTAYNYTDDDGNSVPYPDHYNSENFYCGTEDNGGVHTNSSVINKAAYLMAMGGTFNTCTMTGIGRDKEEAIFYRAETVYYTTSTDFNGAYTALLASCNDLFSIDDCKQVEKALRATELNQAGFCSSEPAVDPGCANVDAVPTITDVNSDTANGYYKAGTSIDIDVTFSEPVSGDVTVTLETGETDQSCTFSVTQETTGTCNYSIQPEDTSSDLSVQSITGTITDSSGDVVTSTLPTTNLADHKHVVIDTTKPTAPTTLRIYTSPQKNKRIKTIHPQLFQGIVKSKTLKPYMQWDPVSDAVKYYVKFSHKPITRGILLNSANRQTTTHLRGTVKDSGKKYYLYMVLQDLAGNKSTIKTLVGYKISP